MLFEVKRESSATLLKTFFSLYFKISRRHISALHHRIFAIIVVRLQKFKSESFYSIRVFTLIICEFLNTREIIKIVFFNTKIYD